MKLIKPSFEIIKQGEGLEGIKKHIELCGRVCYKSEDRITENSAEKFIQSLLNSGHTSVLEHGTVYLDIPLSFDYDDYNNVTMSGHRFIEYSTNPYSFVNIRKGNRPMWNLCVTTNYRVLLKNNWLDDLQYLCVPTEFHEKRVTVRFICDRAIANEFVRHRAFSFSQESTRYCNYSHKKFGNELTYVLPNWIIGGTQESLQFFMALNACEDSYFKLLKLGWKPQQTRAILPLCLKTELVMTGFVNDWWGKYTIIDKSTGLIDKVIDGRDYKGVDNIDRDKYLIVEEGFFPLRCSGNAHPQAQELAITLREEFIKRGLIQS